MVLKRYFQYYDNYLYQINCSDLTFKRLDTINALVDYMTEMRRDNNLTENLLKLYDLIYRVGID